MSSSNTALRRPTADVSDEELAPIFSDRTLYILLERFCGQVSETMPTYEPFLQRHFNDEGYVDIWRIPQAMMDVLLHRTQYNRVFDSREFRGTFHAFIREFLAVCAKECRIETLSQTSAAGALEERLITQGGGEYLNALVTSFSSVLEILASEEHGSCRIKTEK